MQQTMAAEEPGRQADDSMYGAPLEIPVAQQAEAAQQEGDGASMQKAVEQDTGMQVDTGGKAGENMTEQRAAPEGQWHIKVR